MYERTYTHMYVCTGVHAHNSNKINMHVACTIFTTSVLFMHGVHVQTGYGKKISYCLNYNA